MPSGIACHWSGHLKVCLFLLLLFSANSIPRCALFFTCKQYSVYNRCNLEGTIPVTNNSTFNTNEGFVICF